MMSTKLSPSLASSVRLSLGSTSSNTLLSLPDDHIQIGDKFQMEIALLFGTLSSIASSRSSLGMLSRPLPHLHSIFAIMNDVANELLHGGLLYLFIKFLINLRKSD